MRKTKLVFSANDGHFLHILMISAAHTNLITLIIESLSLTPRKRKIVIMRPGREVHLTIKIFYVILLL